MMKRRLLLSLPFLCMVLSLGCGSGTGGETVPTQPLLTEADQKLAGQWVAEKLNATGDRLVMTVTPGTGERAVSLLVVRFQGTTFHWTDGVYAVNENKLSFHLNEGTQFETPFTVSDSKLTLGTDVYLRVVGPVAGGNQIGGQIRIPESAQDEAVRTNARGTLGTLPDIVPGEIVVKYKDGSFGKVVLKPQHDSQLQALSIASGTTLSDLGFAALGHHQEFIQKTVRRAQEINQRKRIRPVYNSGPSALSLDGGFGEGKIEWAVPNTVLRTQAVPTDDNFDLQWNLDVMNMVEAWGQISSTGQTVVAVIDTGIVSHNDLLGRTLTSFGYDFVAPSANDQGIPNLSQDGGGHDPDPTDPGTTGGCSSVWHGTHIAGIISAKLDGHGMVGVAGPADVKVLPIRAMGCGGDGTVFDVAQGILYAAKLPNIADCTGTVAEENDEYVYHVAADGSTCNWTTERGQRPVADAINLSLGAPMTATQAAPLTDAADRATARGVLVVAAAGNDAKGPGWCFNPSSDAFYRNNSCSFYPAADPNVVAVGAVYPNLSFASRYSNYGLSFLAAPGGSDQEGIIGTVSPAAMPGGYGMLTGTSQAAAHVSAVAALVISELKARGVTFNTTTVKDILRLSAIDLGASGRDDYFGNGLVNACGALLMARGLSNSGQGTLNLSSDLVNLGRLGSTVTVLASNSCGSTTLSGLTASGATDDGGNWLQVSLGSHTSTPAPLVVTVSRTGLAQGNYTGHVTVRSSAGDKMVTVKMEVSGSATASAGGAVGGVGGGSGGNIDSLRSQIEQFLQGRGSESPDGSGDGSDDDSEDDSDGDSSDGSGDDSGDGSSDGSSGGFGQVNDIDLGEFIVLLVDADTDVVKGFTRTDFTSDYFFQFSGVTQGRYIVVAGTDEDNDQQICEEGSSEPCLKYPNPDAPEVIEVTSGTRKNDLILSF